MSASLATQTRAGLMSAGDKQRLVQQAADIAAALRAARRSALIFGA